MIYNNDSSIIRKHTVWDSFPAAENFESFQKNILQPIYLKPTINVVFVFEKALRLRSKEINNGLPPRIIFEKLIDWFFNNNYFETNNIDILHQLRHIRNGKAHDEKKSLGGIAYLQKIYCTLDLINDLYEDPQLRLLRKKEIEELQKGVNDFLKDGGIINVDGKRIIIFKADIVFLNNKLRPSAITIVVWPIFDPTPYTQGKHPKLNSIEIELTDYGFNKNGFVGRKSDNSEVSISQISDEVNCLKFISWRGAYYSLPDFVMISFLTHDLNDNFYSSLRKFHQMM